MLVAPVPLMIAYQAASDYENQQGFIELHTLNVNMVKMVFDHIASAGGGSIDFMLWEISASLRECPLLDENPALYWSAFSVDNSAEHKKQIQRILAAIRRTS